MKSNLWWRVGRIALAGAGLAAALSSRPARADSVVVTWDNATLQAIRDIKPGPPHVARILAIVHTCMYDAWAAYDAKAVGTRYFRFLRRPAAEATEANKQKAVSFAAYRALVDLFPQGQEVAMFQGVMTNLSYDFSDTSTDVTTPSGIGNVAANAVLKYRHADGSNQLGDLNGGAPYSDYTGYVAVNTPDTVNDPNHWQPLRVSDGHGGTKIQAYSGPQFGLVTPFALPTSFAFRPPPPPKYGTAAYKSIVRATISQSAHLTDTHKMTSEYFADGPASEFPPGHWCLFAQVVSHRDNYGIDQDVKLFFAVANAEMDAGIACWECKRAYDFVRPITAVRYMYKGKTINAWAGPGLGTQPIPGENFRPYGQPDTQITPPFPEYVSGHSTFSAAGAEVLKRFTGSDRFGHSVTFQPGSSAFEPGVTPHTAVTLSWPTFTSAAEMAGLSRLYSSIHFGPQNKIAQRMGRNVGRVVYEKALTYFNGTAEP